MSLMEDRNCGCGCDVNNEIQDPVVEYTCGGSCGNDKERRIDCEQKEEMLQEIRSQGFAITELCLYLDTHPEDQKALCLHRKYARRLKDLEDKYQKVYGPLTINFPCNKWRWLEEPWPWERSSERGEC